MPLTVAFDSDVETLFNLMTDPDFLVERSMALGELNADCEVEDFDDETIVRMTREVRRELPSVLAKMFNPVQTMQMEEIWRRDGDGWTGEYSITVQGQPVTLSATFSLTANGDGCIYAIEHRCRANIPLVGGRVEKFVLAQAVAGAEDELAYARRQLRD